MKDVAAVSIVNNANPASVLERAQEMLQSQAGTLVHKEREIRQKRVPPSPQGEKIRMRERREEEKRTGARDQGKRREADKDKDDRSEAGRAVGIHVTV
ncbi:MAG: hypothetical protein JRJ35_10895 [Deltaproteobacteria bacterium]|nr:hypothetical protein [Deltaproteobacteria bacterium]MBW1923969.1 hypothetical protein [Deltaproteobacteria bacterium]MBW1948494.1 hypothetical protein [Deltaproteobacteria bacterium]MBW2006659.1 hypothetical protein [Deltaproteobacteria bacterium]MBW2101197.1 hypothetical protein [Deltaproteobacteria bacterium]